MPQLVVKNKYALKISGYKIYKNSLHELMLKYYTLKSLWWFLKLVIGHAIHNVQVRQLLQCTDLLFRLLLYTVYIFLYILTARTRFTTGQPQYFYAWPITSFKNHH